jgi:hypothetical protein
MQTSLWNQVISGRKKVSIVRLPEKEERLSSLLLHCAKFGVDDIPLQRLKQGVFSPTLWRHLFITSTATLLYSGKAT